jgi:anti-anti-sigma factor
MNTSVTYRSAGRLDTTTAGAAEKDLLALLVNDVNSINMDLSQLDYVSSAGLRVLLVVAKAAKAKGGKLTLIAPKPSILEVIKISGFDRIINIQS